MVPVPSLKVANLLAVLMKFTGVYDVHFKSHEELSANRLCASRQSDRGKKSREEHGAKRVRDCRDYR